MAFRKLKFPLKMKEGTEVHHIEDLIQHFDLGKIVGYFLDGKLLAWLDSRHYEEAKKVKELELEDENIAYKMCDIFHIELTTDLIEEAERVKNIIHKLKQYTSDVQIIRNFEYVVFNQEELNALYEESPEMIILCESKYSIPSDKRDLNYILIGEASIEEVDPCTSDGLDKADQNNAKIFEDQEIEEDPVPDESEDLLDGINTNPFVILNDWIVWLHPSDAGDKIIEERVKKDNSKTISRELHENRAVDQIVGNENEYLISRKGQQEISIVNVKLDTVKTIGNDRKRDSLFYVSNKTILYEADSRRILKINRLTNQKMEIVQGNTREQLPDDCWFTLSDSYVVYVLKENRKRIAYKYDLQTGSREVLMDMGKGSIKMMDTYNDYLYYMMQNETNGCLSLIRVNLNSKDESPMTCFTTQSWGRYSISRHNFLKGKPYMMFIEPGKNPRVYCFNCILDTQYTFCLGNEWNRTITSTGKNIKQIVGDYLYFRSNTGKNIYKVKLR